MFTTSQVLSAYVIKRKEGTLLGAIKAQKVVNAQNKIDVTTKPARQFAFPEQELRQRLSVVEYAITQNCGTDIAGASRFLRTYF